MKKKTIVPKISLIIQRYQSVVRSFVRRSFGPVDCSAVRSVDQSTGRQIGESIRDITVSYLMCIRNGELHDEEFLQDIYSHCRRTTEITGWEDLKEKKCDVNPFGFTCLFRRIILYLLFSFSFKSVSLSCKFSLPMHWFQQPGKWPALSFHLLPQGTPPRVGSHDSYQLFEAHF